MYALDAVDINKCQPYPPKIGLIQIWACSFHEEERSHRFVIMSIHAFFLKYKEGVRSPEMELAIFEHCCLTCWLVIF